MWPPARMHLADRRSSLHQGGGECGHRPACTSLAEGPACTWEEGGGHRPACTLLAEGPACTREGGNVAWSGIYELISALLLGEPGLGQYNF